MGHLGSKTAHIYAGDHTMTEYHSKQLPYRKSIGVAQDPTLSSSMIMQVQAGLSCLITGGSSAILTYRCTSRARLGMGSTNAYPRTPRTRAKIVKIIIIRTAPPNYYGEKLK